MFLLVPAHLVDLDKGILNGILLLLFIIVDFVTKGIAIPMICNLNCVD